MIIKQVEMVDDRVRPEKSRVRASSRQSVDQGEGPVFRSVQSKVASVGLLVGSMLGGAFVASVATAGPSQAAAKPHGAPVIISMLADINAPSVGFEFQEAITGANAAVGAVNKAGGVHGRPLKLIICDGQGNPNTETACANTAVSDGTVATVGDADFINPTAPILQPAGIAEIMDNPASPVELNNPVSFPVNGSAFLGVFGQLLLAKDYIHATKISVIANGPSASVTETNAKTAATAMGMSVVNTITLTGNETDLTPTVEAAAANGSQAFILLMPPDNAASVISAMKQNDIAAAPDTIALTPAQVKAFGSAASGIYEVDYFPPISLGLPGTKLYVKQITAYDKNAVLDTTSTIPWLAVHMFANVANSLPTVTRASILKAMTDAKNLNTYGLIPPYSTNKPFTGLGGAFPRAFNQTFWFDVIKNGKTLAVVKHAVNVVG
jgi:branched-chain amino acid transport system substrate-binding protein